MSTIEPAEPAPLDETPPLETLHEVKEAEPVPAGQKTPYVLVVDDEAPIQDFLSRCLENAGYLARKAGTAAEALEIMVTAPASVILCDVRMPGHDGLWLAQRLRAHWPDAAVIMVTAVNDWQTIQQARELGVVDWLTKPINRERLLQVIRRTITSATDRNAAPEEPTEVAAEPASAIDKMEAQYMLEYPVRCPVCGERLTTVKAVRLIRTQVNFTSTLPRRGRVIACPHCLAIIPAELTNF